MSFGSTLWTGTKSVGKGIGNAVLQNLGIVEKAVIEIADFTQREVKEEDVKKPGGGGSLVALGTTGLGGFDTDLALSYAKNIKSVAQNLQKMTAGGDGGFDINKDFQRFRFEVPFNPNELTITGYGGEEMMVQNFSNKNKSGEQPKQAPQQANQQEKAMPERSNAIKTVSSHVEMNIPLIFDKTNNQDAFYSDKFTLGTTSLVRGAINVGKGLANKADYSVQKEVESFTYILRNHNMQLMRFTWGDMSYQGILNGVNAQYTMFNVEGIPCRATVSLRLVILDSDYPDQTRIFINQYKKDVGFSEQNSLASAAGNLTGLH
ncbi:MAG: hypothetical protein J6W58_03900 [Lachnospiraceae bacterium]|nr:hypothetical protein [Lachnospiraceae bacterium]MBP5745426.1 hypothetical protein [Lachnospiraceae bacterium]